MAEYITCKELIDFLDDYIAGTQPQAVRAEFEKHLGVCPACVDYLRTYRDTIELTKAACEEGCSPPAPPDLVKAILEARKKQG